MNKETVYEFGVKGVIPYEPGYITIPEKEEPLTTIPLNCKPSDEIKVRHFRPMVIVDPTTTKHISVVPSDEESIIIFKCITDQQKSICELNNAISMHKKNVYEIELRHKTATELHIKKFERFQAMSFFNRIKFLFFGHKFDL